MENKLRTIDHRLFLNSSGVLIFEADQQYEDEDLDRRDAQEWQFQELLAVADFVNANRERLSQLQQDLERTWLAVADEVLDYLEAERKEEASTATSTDAQRVLERLGSVTRIPRPEPVGIAGKWYQSLWRGPLGEDASLFLQEWNPFLRVFHRRKLERFPNAYPIL